MPSIDYQAFADVVNNLIAQFGVSATLSSKPPGTYNATTSLATVTPVTMTVNAIAFPYPEKMIDGSAIIRGDQQAFIAPSGVTQEVRPSDKFTYLGVVYVVVNVKNFNPGGTSLLYELQVRK